MTSDEVSEIKDMLLPYIPQLAEEEGLDMIYIMITNIIDESTLLIMTGNNAEEVVSTAFSTTVNDSAAFLPGVVSRKKQLIPNLLYAYQQLS